MTHLMDMMRALMASVTALVLEARSCQVGASLGLTARLLAEVSRLLEDLITLCPAWGRGEGQWCYSMASQN